MSVHLYSVSMRIIVLAAVSLSARAALAAPPDRLAELHAAAARSDTKAASAKLSPALRAAYVQARQKEAGPEYGVITRGAQVVATNAPHRLALTLDAQGVHLQNSAGTTLGSLRLTSAGCAERPTPLAAVAPRGQGTRVEYPRPDLTEWYLNGPLGLEQGFTMTRDPGCSRLGFELQLGAEWTAKLVGSGDRARVELSAKGSGQRVYYSDLFARDAQGKELATQLLLTGQTIRLEVDAAGARYPVEVDPLMAVEQALDHADGAPSDVAGYWVAVSGDTAVVTVPGKAALQGTVYVYVRTGSTWIEQQKIVDPDGVPNDVFGFAAALSGNTLLVSSPRRTVGTNMFQGQVFFYVRTGTRWTQQQVITASDGQAQAQFGNAVALSGNTAVVASPAQTVGANVYQGQVYVYTRTGTTWTERQLLTASDGESGDGFGNAVAINGDTLAVGAVRKTVDMKSNQGQVYVFTRSAAVWSEQQKLTASDGAVQSFLGYSVAISGDTLLASAIGNVVGTNTYQGEAYVFTRTGTVWSQQQKLTASDGDANAQFGFSVALNGNTAILGSPLKTVGTNANQGQTYTFVRQGTTWTEQPQRLAAVNPMPSQYFGYSVAMDGTTIVVGAPLVTVGTSANQGSAYVFFIPFLVNGTQCDASADCESGFCTDGVCCNTLCGSGSKTDCQSCLAVESGGSDGTCTPIASRLNTTCRATAGVCDSAELCDGTNVDCPADRMLAAGTVCQTAADVSQRDAVCSGTSAACPANLPAYQFSGGGVSGCATSLPLGVGTAPGAAGAAWALTALVLLTRRRARGARS